MCGGGIELGRCRKIRMEKVNLQNYFKQHGDLGAPMKFKRRIRYQYRTISWKFTIYALVKYKIRLTHKYGTTCQAVIGWNNWNEPLVWILAFYDSLRSSKRHGYYFL